MKALVTTEDLKDLSSDDPKVKYGRVKRLLAIAREHPEQLYPHIEFFVKLLKSENNILRWTAIDIIGHLSRVDTDKRIGPDGSGLPKLFAFIGGGKLITAAHAISASGVVAQSRPEYRRRITKELLKVEHNTYETEECRNIAIGKVIETIGTYFKDVKERDDVLDFVRRQTTNTRAATRKKAVKFLQRAESPNSKPD